MLHNTIILGCVWCYKLVLDSFAVEVLLNGPGNILSLSVRMKVDVTLSYFDCLKNFGTRLPKSSPEH